MTTHRPAWDDQFRETEEERNERLRAKRPLDSPLRTRVEAALDIAKKAVLSSRRHYADFAPGLAKPQLDVVRTLKTQAGRSLVRAFFSR